jgi:hypothetical protein
MALTKITGFGIGTIVDNVVMTSDDPTITMTDSSGTTDIATLVATSGALIVTARDGNSDGEIIFKGDTGSAVTEHARIASTGLMTVISEGNAVQTSVQQGLTKAWGNSAANGASIANSFNIASLTDQATGQQFFNLTNNFSDGNLGGGTAQTSVGNEMITASGTTSQDRLYAFDGSAYQDQSLMFNMCGDQA